MKKTLVYILALVSLLGLLTGCGAKNNDDAVEPTPDVTDNVLPMETPDANEGVVNDEDGIIEENEDDGIVNDSNGMLGDNDGILDSGNGLLDGGNDTANGSDNNTTPNRSKSRSK